MTDTPPRFAALRMLKRLVAPPAPRRLPGVPGRVHPDDTMLYDESAQSIEDYLRAARSAVDNLERALSEVGRSFEDVESCLDFGCGYGRVLRLLRERIPPAKITACDVDRKGVRFCARELGVRPLCSSFDVARIRLETYDLIWSGSVFTHLDETACRRLLAKLGHALVPGSGVLVFSIHGQLSLDNLGHFYGGSYAACAGDIRREVGERGICFRPYPVGSFGRFPVPYGMTWHRPEYFEELAVELFGDGLELRAWWPHGWDGHHDVLVFRRPG